MFELGQPSQDQSLLRFSLFQQKGMQSLQKSIAQNLPQRDVFLLFLFHRVFLIFKVNYLIYFIITIYFEWPHKYIQYSVICRTVCFPKFLLLHSGLIYRHRNTAKTDFVPLCYSVSTGAFINRNKLCRQKITLLLDKKRLANSKFICV